MARAALVGFDVAAMVDISEPYRFVYYSELVETAEKYDRDNLRYLAKVTAIEVSKLFKR